MTEKFVLKKAKKLQNRRQRRYQVMSDVVVLEFFETSHVQWT